MRRLHALALALCAALLTLALTAPVHAAALQEALARFAADSYGETETAIGEVAQSGDPRSAEIIQALADGRLLYGPGRRTYIKDKSAALFDAATGESAAGEPPAGLKPVRVNNRIRRAIESAMGGLTLLSPDPAKRLEAAQAVFRSRDAAALPALEQALAQEEDGAVRRALAEARAAVVLGQREAPEADQLEAVALLG